MPQVLANLVFPGGSSQAGADLPVVFMGTSTYAIPSAAANLHAYPVPLFYNCQITRLILACKTAPTATTTIQLRRGTRSGSVITWADISGWAASLSSAEELEDFSTTAANLDNNDFLGFSISAGNASGTGLLVAVTIARR